MRALLFGAAAFVVGCMGWPALGGDLKIQVGGYMIQWIGYAKNEDPPNSDYAEWDEKSSAEIHFTAATSFDNGLDLKTVVEMESDAPNGFRTRTIDQSYLELSGERFGALQLGAIDDITKQNRHGSADVALGSQAGDHTVFVVPPSNFTILYYAHYDGGGNANKATYMSPSFGGFRVAGSYTPDGDGTDSAQTQPVSGGAFYSSYVGQVLFERDFGPVAVAMDGAFARSFRSSTRSGLTAIQTGLDLTWGDVTLGTSFLRVLEDADTIVASGSNDGFALDVGLSYKTGPWAASAIWLHTRTDGDPDIPGEDHQHLAQLSASYEFGPGIYAIVTGLWVDYDDEGATAADSNDGWAVLPGIFVSF